MKSVTLMRLDPSIVVSVGATAVVFAAFGSAHSIARLVAVLVEIGWRYLSNTVG